MISDLKSGFHILMTVPVLINGLLCYFVELKTKKKK